MLTVLIFTGCAIGEHTPTEAPSGAIIYSKDGPRNEDRNGLTPPRLLDPGCEEPPYPSMSVASKESAAVLVSFLISSDGTVSDARVESTSGDARLDEAALDSMQSCRFDAALQYGKPVSFRGVQRIVFKAEPETASIEDADDAIRLVHAAHLDQMSLAVFQVAYEHSFKEGEISSEQLACIQAADVTPFSKLFVAPLHAALSNDEIMTAIAFLESPAGKKYVAVHVAEVYSSLKATSPIEKPIYSEQDKRSIDSFLKTTVGAKLLGLNSVFYDPAIKNAVAPMFLALSRKCAQTP
jgi:TonB family protein